ncbi:MAG: hypothetical protein ILO34_07900 [Kiritimatiellae bacterium]|nr:hypothetical protein [Kiritimatiellia bacterium]
MERSARIVDPAEVLAKSVRYDLIFKVALAKAWESGDRGEIRIAEEAYLEMVRSRNGFYEAEPFRDKPEDFIESFRRTAASIRENGYDLSRPAIPVDGDGELLNGAHRLAACFAYGRKCPVVCSDRYPAGGSVHKTFVKGHIHPSVANWGIRKYFELVPEGTLAKTFGSKDDYPSLPFPSWTRRNILAFPYKVKPALMWIWYGLLLPFRKGEKREKMKRRILRERKKITGYAALAEYWRRRDANG